MTTGTDEEIKLSEGNLKTFKEKSEQMIPKKCFGGYCKDDPVCRDWCARAIHQQILSKSERIKYKLSEYNSELFCNDFGHSCEEERHQLEKQIREAQEALKRSDEGRRQRDLCYLAEGSEGIRRIPVGNVRYIQELRDFTQEKILYLATKGKLPDHHELNYKMAVARLYKIRPHGVATLGYVKSTDTKLPEWADFPLIVLNQESKRKFLVLTTQIAFQEDTRMLDTYKLNGQQVVVEVYKQSTRTNVQVDDLGKL